MDTYKTNLLASELKDAKGVREPPGSFKSILQRRASHMFERTTSNNARLLTPKEMAAILKISTNTVHNREWRRRNGCPIIKIGKRAYAMETFFWKWVHEKGMMNNEDGA